MRKFYFLLTMCLGIASNAQVGTLCSNPIVISSLPYTTTDNTANYADNYDVAAPSSTNGNTLCPPAATYPYSSQAPYAEYYMSGNDVIYSYTPTVSGAIKIEIPSAVNWTSMYVYSDCANIGTSALACSLTTSAGARTIDNFAVTAGQTYYILISSWSTPQTVAYTLNVTSLSLSTSEAGAAKADVSVYPNPADDILNFKSKSDIASASIYDMKGRKLSDTAVNNNQINVRQLKSGSYIVEFTDKKGETYTKIFIKK